MSVTLVRLVPLARLRPLAAGLHLSAITALRASTFRLATASTALLANTIPMLVPYHLQHVFHVGLVPLPPREQEHVSFVRLVSMRIAADPVFALVVPPVSSTQPWALLHVPTAPRGSTP